MGCLKNCTMATKKLYHLVTHVKLMKIAFIKSEFSFSRCFQSLLLLLTSYWEVEKCFKFLICITRISFSHTCSMKTRSTTRSQSPTSNVTYFSFCPVHSEQCLCLITGLIIWFFTFAWWHNLDSCTIRTAIESSGRK